MVSVDPIESLNEAVPLYLGYGLRAEPKIDLERVADRFGDKAWRLRPLLEELVQEVHYISSCLHERPDEANGEWAVGLLQDQYPFLNAGSRAALAWFWERSNL